MTTENIVSAGILVVRDGFALAIGSSPKNPGGFGLPFGKVNDGEMPPEAARRELLEETGYEADGEIRLLFTRECEGGVAATFLAQSVSGKPRPSREGCPAWVPLESLKIGRYGEYNTRLLKAYEDVIKSSEGDQHEADQ